MQAFWKELRDLAGSPDLLAVLVLSLLLGLGPQLARWSPPEAWRLPILTRPGQLCPVIPLPEALEGLRWQWRLPR